MLSIRRTAGLIATAFAFAGLAPAAQAAARDCGETVNGWTVTANNTATSCAFARSTNNAISRFQSLNGVVTYTFYVRAYSPVTGRTYRMRCDSGYRYTNCSGGNGASVSVRG